MSVQMVKQYSVFVANKPGALSEVAKLFADAGVSLIGIASEVRDDSGVLRFAVEGGADGGDVLVAHGFSAIEKPLLSVEVADKPGELFRLTAALAAAGVNITTVYGTALAGQRCRILFAVDDSKKAQKALEAYEGAAKGGKP